MVSSSCWQLLLSSPPQSGQGRGVGLCHQARPGRPHLLACIWSEVYLGSIFACIAWSLFFQELQKFSLVFPGQSSQLRLKYVLDQVRHSAAEFWLMKPTQSSAPWTEIFQPEPLLDLLAMNGLWCLACYKAMCWVVFHGGVVFSHKRALDPWHMFHLRHNAYPLCVCFLASFSWQTFVVFFSVWLTSTYLIVANCGSRYQLWQPLPPVPVEYSDALGFGCAVLSGCHLYLFGGKDPVKGSMRRVVYYSARTNKWHRAKDMQRRRHFFGFCVINNCLFVAGGECEGVQRSLRSAEMYDPNKNKWSYISDMSTAMVPFIGVVFGGRSVLCFLLVCYLLPFSTQIISAAYGFPGCEVFMTIHVGVWLSVSTEVFSK